MPKLKAQTQLGEDMPEGRLEGGPGNVAFVGEQVLSDLFTNHNNPIPSSAVIEHFLSKVKDILMAMRTFLSDSNFERLMFMKGNQHHIKEM